MANNIPDEVVNASIKVLSNKNFSCDKELFPDKKLTLPQLNVSFYSPSELCDLFFKRQVAFRTVGDYLVAEYDGATLNVKGNYFYYKTQATPKKKSMSKYKSAIKKLGLNLKEIDFDEKTLIFRASYKSIRLNGTHLKINLDEDGEICLLEGVWPKEMHAGMTEKVSFCDEIVNLSGAFPNGGNIQSIDIIYSLSNTNSKKYYYKPQWKVTVDKKTKII